MRTALALRTVTGRVNGDGTKGSGTADDWTVTRTGTGVYVLRFTPPFRALLSFVWSPAHFGAGFTTVAGFGDTFLGPIQVNTYNTGSAPADYGWSFVATGLPRT